MKTACICLLFLLVMSDSHFRLQTSELAKCKLPFDLSADSENAGASRNPVLYRGFLGCIPWNTICSHGVLAASVEPHSLSTLNGEGTLK